MTTEATTAMEVIAQLLRENNELRKGMLIVNGNGATKKGRAPRHAVRCLDTKTGSIYHSHASAGMAVAPEFGLKVHNFVWYEVIVKAPGRFQDISEEKYQETLKANAEKQEKKEPAAGSPLVPVAHTNLPPKPVVVQGNKGK